MATKAPWRGYVKNMTRAVFKQEATPRETAAVFAALNDVERLGGHGLIRQYYGDGVKLAEAAEAADLTTEEAKQIHGIFYLSVALHFGLGE